MTLDNRGRPVEAPDATTTTTPTTTATPLLNTPVQNSGQPANTSTASNPSLVATYSSDSSTTMSSPTTTNDTVVVATPTADQLINNFPEQKLRSLLNKISNSRWVVPVLPDQELECLLNYAIRLTKAGIDHDSESCMRFYRESLYISFMKILTDEAVNSWKYNIHFCILNTCGKLLQLCALHMDRDNPYLLDLLTVVLDPENKFNMFNVSRASDQYVASVSSTPSVSGAVPTSAAAVTVGGNWGILEEHTTYAKSPPEPRSPRGWLVDLLNRFGQFGGFDNLLARFNAGIEDLKASALESGTNSSADDLEQKRKISSSSTGLGETSKITLNLVFSLLRPFGQCYELLTVPTIERYFMPIWEVVLGLMDGLTDEDLKREAKPEGRSDSINGIVKAARALASRLPNQEHLIKDLEMFRLKMILRLLKVSGFNGKMNALNEINKVINAVTYLPHCVQPTGGAGQVEEDIDWLNAERMAVSYIDSDLFI